MKIDRIAQRYGKLPSEILEADAYNVGVADIVNIIETSAREQAIAERGM